MKKIKAKYYNRELSHCYGDVYIIDFVYCPSGMHAVFLADFNNKNIAKIMSDTIDQFDVDLTQLTE